MLFNIEQTRGGTQEEIQQSIADQLAEIAQELDSEYVNEMHVARPDSGMDPFNPPSSLTEYIVQKEREGKHSVSLVLNIFYEKLDTIPEDAEGIDVSFIIKYYSGLIY